MYTAFLHTIWRIPLCFSTKKDTTVINPSYPFDNFHRYLITEVFMDSGRVRETNPFPEYHPQAEFTSAEENSRFQGFCRGTYLFIPLL